MATALEEKQRLIEEILQLPHQVEIIFRNIIRMMNIFSLYKNHSIVMVNMHFESVITRKLTLQ